MKILFVSDEVVPEIYSENIVRRFKDIDLVVGLGDLPFSYYDFIVSMLNKPLYYVRGNHDAGQEEERKKLDIKNEMNLHGRVVRFKKTILAGFEGSNKYSSADRVQYSELEMSTVVLKMGPKLWWNRSRYKRFLDIAVAHTAPYGYGEPGSNCHAGFKCLRKFIEFYRPAYFVHGHIHLYDRNTCRISEYGKTKIINAYGYYVLNVE